MANKNGLKPCPFCGRQQDFYYYHKGTENEIVCVECPCGATDGKNSPSEKSAKDKWNRRRSPNNI